jgi:hypothetical protein
MDGAIHRDACPEYLAAARWMAPSMRVRTLLTPRTPGGAVGGNEWRYFALISHLVRSYFALAFRAGRCHCDSAIE